MAGIVFSDDVDWMVSRWIFRRLLQVLQGDESLDGALQEPISIGIANDLLSIDYLDPELGQQLVSSLRETAIREMGQESISGLSSDDLTMYRRALASLLRLIDACRA